MKALHVRLLLIVGIVLVAFSFLVKGPDIISETGSHVIRDLTVDLFPHLLILGAVLIVYAFYRMGMVRC